MFGFKKKEVAEVSAKVEQSQQMPEGFELLSECEFAEVSGGVLSPISRPDQL